jgi:hypothetical protein
MRINSAGDVGIGTSSPAQILHLRSAAPAIEFDDSAFATVRGRISSDEGNLVLEADYQNSRANSNIAFKVDNTERMRIDASGNLLVGTTDTTIFNDNADEYGFIVEPTGQMQLSANNSTMLYLNRQNGDGDIVDFRKDGATVGSIGVVSSNNLKIHGTVSGHSGLSFGTGIVYPTDNAGAATDNVTDLGSASFRWNDAFITNGVTTGSDGNDKQDIETLSDAEQRVAVACKGLLRKWRWKSAVEEKGDEARIHFGIIAQDLQAAFEAEGLDAGRYALFMSNTWTDEETGEERTRLGVRYHELLAFIIAAI